MFQTAWEVNAGLARQPAPDLSWIEDVRAEANRGVRWARENTGTIEEVRNCIEKGLRWLSLSPARTM